MEFDEGYSELDNCSTLSLVPSIIDYIHENGRTYATYKFAAYTFPKDEDELNRLDLMHALITVAFDGYLHRAPIESNPQRILDIGCGTGNWCIDMGDIYPSAEVIGIDIGPFQPLWVPTNVSFQIDDIEDEWTFSRPFDYIHARYMIGTVQDWPRLMRQCFKSGGWVELQDFGPDRDAFNRVLPKESHLMQYLTNSNYPSETESETVNPGSSLIHWMQEAGFINIYSERRLLPIGTWMENLPLNQTGCWNEKQPCEGLSGLNMQLFVDGLGCHHQQIDDFLAGVGEDIKDYDVNASIEFHLVYGQKP